MLRIKLMKSPIGHNTRNRATIQALGLRKIHQIVEHEDTPTIRGMIHHIHPLLKVEEVEGTPAKRNVKGVGKKRSTPRAIVEPKPKSAPKPKAPKPVKAEKPAPAPKAPKAEKVTAAEKPAKVAKAPAAAKPAAAKAPAAKKPAAPKKESK
jgi:large subunit ribosomal protein L30